MTSTQTSAPFKSVQNLRLENTIVVRKVPMNEQGCNMLRAIRDFQKDFLKQKEGLEVEIPFPTSFHMLMQDYCSIKGIKVEKPTIH